MTGERPGPDNPYAQGDPANPLGPQFPLVDAPTAVAPPPRSMLAPSVWVWPIALFGGLTGLVLALVSESWSGILAMAVLGPTVEEAAKPVGVIWLIGNRPKWLASGLQVVVLAMLAGAVFGTIENLLYLSFTPSPELAAWRWAVCLPLHVAASGIFGLGLARSWALAVRHGGGFQVGPGLGHFVAAVALHGLYNVAVLLFAGAGRPVF